MNIENFCENEMKISIRFSKACLIA